MEIFFSGSLVIFFKYNFFKYQLYRLVGVYKFWKFYKKVTINYKILRIRYERCSPANMSEKDEETRLTMLPTMKYKFYSDQFVLAIARACLLSVMLVGLMFVSFYYNILAGCIRRQPTAYRKTNNFLFHFYI